MSITIELEELKADFLEDLKKSIEKKKDVLAFVDNKEKLKPLYVQFFWDFAGDFPFEIFCAWLEANTGLKIQ